MFNDAAIVVAHPDDEILWFSSLIERVQRVVIAFLATSNADITQGRSRVIALHPKPGLLCLGLTEAGTFALAALGTRPTEYGVKLRDGTIDAAYRANHARLLADMLPVLTNCREVYTHSPWGEYGHPDHIQVYRVVCQLQEQLGFRLWFPNYISRRAKSLRAMIAPSLSLASHISLPTDIDLARRFERLYKENNCWTWYSSYRWPESEELLCQASGPACTGTGYILASEYEPIILDNRLGLPDRLRWEKAALRQRLGCSSIGRRILRLAGYAKV